MSERWTKREKDFCRLVVENGGDKLKAYQDAGYSQSMHILKQHTQADKLFNKPKLNLKIQELQKEADEIAKERFSISIEERLRRLDHLYKCGSEELINAQGIKGYQNLAVAVKTVEVMNSMLGSGEDEETADPLNITFSVSPPVKDIRVTRGS